MRRDSAADGSLSSKQRKLTHPCPYTLLTHTCLYTSRAKGARKILQEKILLWQQEQGGNLKRLRASVPTAVTHIQYHKNPKLSIQGNTYFCEKNEKTLLGGVCR